MDYQDTNFTDVKDENTSQTEDNNKDKINGKPMYYSISQVAQMIGETDSTIRYWCAKFEAILQVERSGTHRKFTEDNIKKLEWIKNLLREEHFSINQVLEYGEKKETGIIKQDLKKQDPFAIQAIASAIMIELGGYLEDYKEDLKQGIKDELCKTQDTIIDTIKTQNTDIKQLLDIKELEETKRLANIEDNLKESMKQREATNQKPKKSLFEKLFNRD